MISVARPGAGSGGKKQPIPRQQSESDASEDELPDLPTESATMSQETSGTSINQY